MDSNVLPPADHVVETPSAARMYDYYLGGHHNFEVDRVAAEHMISLYPETRLVALANRAFLRRAVTFLVQQGIDQFLDLGSGIPTVGNVHLVAQQLNPQARVVYVDIDPVAVTHSAALLEHNPNATIVRADVRQIDALLATPAVREMLDFSRPIAVLIIALLHFVTDDAEVAGLLNRLRAGLVPGSYLAIGHGTLDEIPPDALAQIEQLYRRTTHAVRMRPAATIHSFFGGLELVEPGVVYAPLWRPEDEADILLDQPARSLNLVGIGCMRSL